MNKKISFLFLFLLSIVFANAQNSNYIDIDKYTDCKSAKKISTTEKFGPTGTPAKTPIPNDPYGREQHIVWYKFKTIKKGKLTFEIIPNDTLDNFDFVLYKVENNNFCNDFASNKIKPLRKNYARNTLNNMGITGLSALGDDKTYSPAIDVKENQEYYLAVLNMFDKSGGHVIKFRYLDKYTIKGQIADIENNKPLKDTKILFKNLRTNEIIGQAFSDKKGNYELEIGVYIESHTFPQYELTVFSDKYFIEDSIIASKELLKIQKTKYNFKLDKLKKDKKFPENIYFDPNSPSSIVLPGSMVALKKVEKLMLMNPNVHILAEGHSNGFLPSTHVDKRLSEDRANAIKEYLVNKGINPSRIDVLGSGCTKQIYTQPMDETQEGYNRRVEIYIKEK